MKIRLEDIRNRNAARIRQHYRYDCGAACLASVAAHYGKRISLAEARMECGCTADGISVQGIIDGASALGMEAKGWFSKDRDLQDLERITAPAIVHLRTSGGFCHYGVLMACSAGQVKIMDPASGRVVRLEARSFRERWTGYLITAVPGKDFVAAAGGRSPLFPHLRQILAYNRTDLILSLLFSAACTGAGITLSAALQHVIDHVLPQRETGLLIGVCILACLITGLSLYAAYLGMAALIRSSIRTDALIVTAFVRQLTVLPQRFFDSLAPGDISSRIDDIRHVRQMVTDGIVSLATGCLAAAGAIAVMFIHHPGLAGCAAAFLPLYLLLYRLSGYQNRKYHRRCAGSAAAFETDLLELSAGLPAARQYHCAEAAGDRALRKYIRLAGDLETSARASGIFQVLMQGTSRMAVLAVLLAGMHAVLHNRMTLGELMTFYSLSAFFTVPLSELAQCSERFSRAAVSAERIREILDLPPERTGGLPVPETIGKLEMKQVVFGYPGGKRLFDRLDLCIEDGKTTLILGRNGSGKSTLARLLVQEYEPEEGHVTCSGTDIRNFRLEEWRARIGYVPQRPPVFKGTLLENLILNDPDPDMERLMKIAADLGLDDLALRLPDGWMTPVDGNRLSGGECRKIAIARALYKNPEIYIFDEPGSWTDPQGKKAVMDCITVLRKQHRTVIVISHEREDISIADNVVHIDALAQSGYLRSTCSVG